MEGDRERERENAIHKIDIIQNEVRAVMLCVFDMVSWLPPFLEVCLCNNEVLFYGIK